MKTARLNNGFHVNHSQDSSAKNGEFSNNQGGALLSAHTLIFWCSFTCALTACGTSITIFVSNRLKGKYRVLEWSLLVKGQTMPLRFTRDNQALYGFATVCAELAGAVLESGEWQLTESLQQQSRYLNSNRDHVDDIESRNASRTANGITRLICLSIPVMGDDL